MGKNNSIRGNTPGRRHPSIVKEVSIQLQLLTLAWLEVCSENEAICTEEATFDKTLRK